MNAAFISWNIIRTLLATDDGLRPSHCLPRIPSTPHHSRSLAPAHSNPTRFTQLPTRERLHVPHRSNRPRPPAATAATTSPSPPFTTTTTTLPSELTLAITNADNLGDMYNVVARHATRMEAQDIIALLERCKELAGTSSRCGTATRSS